MKQHTLSLDATITKSPKAVSAVIDDQMVLYTVEQSMYFVLNSTGLDIWNSLNQHHVLSQVLDDLASQYQCTADDLTHDVITFLNELQERKLVSIA